MFSLREQHVGRMSSHSVPTPKPTCPRAANVVAPSRTPLVPAHFRQTSSLSPFSTKPKLKALTLSRTTSTSASASRSAGASAAGQWRPRDTKNMKGRAKDLLRKLKRVSREGHGTSGIRLHHHRHPNKCDDDRKDVDGDAVDLGAGDLGANALSIGGWRRSGSGSGGSGGEIAAVVAVLDEWAAFQLEFPLLAVKQTVNKLRSTGQWARVLQVCKWMLMRGYGDTWGTYAAMLEALSVLQRFDEMDGLWESLMAQRGGSLPRVAFALAMRLHCDSSRFDKALEVFGSMEAFGLLVDGDILDMATGALERLGAPQGAAALRQQYCVERRIWRYQDGRRTRAVVFAREDRAHC